MGAEKEMPERDNKRSKTVDARVVPDSIRSEITQAQEIALVHPTLAQEVVDRIEANLSALERRLKSTQQRS